MELDIQVLLAEYGHMIQTVQAYSLKNMRESCSENRLIRVFYLRHNLQHSCSSELRLAYGCATVGVISLLITVISTLLASTYKTAVTN